VKLVLLVGDDCPPCDKATDLWRHLSTKYHLALEVLNIDDPAGLAFLGQRRLGSLPALFIDNELAAIGLQTPQQALELIGIARPEHTPGATCGLES
jgi:hypothetical protein